MTDAEEDGAVLCGRANQSNEARQQRPRADGDLHRQLRRRDLVVAVRHKLQAHGTEQEEALQRERRVGGMGWGGQRVKW